MAYRVLTSSGGRSANLIGWHIGRSGNWENLTPDNGFDTIRSIVHFSGEIFACGGIDVDGYFGKWNTDGLWDILDTVNDGAFTRLAEHKGSLYCGCSNGHLYRFDGIASLNSVAPPCSGESISEIYSDGTTLYALDGTNTGIGTWLLSWNEIDGWNVLGSHIGSPYTLANLVIRSGEIYCIGSDNDADSGGYSGPLYHYNSGSFDKVADGFYPDSELKGLIIHEDKIYTSSWAGASVLGGKLYEWNEIDAWVEKTGYFKSGEADYPVGWANLFENASGELYATWGLVYGSNAKTAISRWNGIDDWTDFVEPVLYGGFHAGNENISFETYLTPDVFFEDIDEGIGFNDSHKDYHLGARVEEGIGFNCVFAPKITFNVDVEEGIGFNDSNIAYHYTRYGTVVDRPYIGPIRIAKIELTGKTIYVCDRLWENISQGGECMYDYQLYEPLIIAWNHFSVGEIDAVDLTENPADLSLTLENSVPVGGYDSFGDLFNVFDPYYAKVTVTEFFEEDPPTDGIEIFVGYIEKAEVDQQNNSIDLTCTGFEISLDNKFTHELVDIDTRTLIQMMSVRCFRKFMGQLKGSHSGR